jgi:hypothetical protein
VVALDKDRLAKLLSMTSSEHDAEALAAIRKANDLLRLNRKSWFDVLSAPPPVEPLRPDTPSAGPRAAPSATPPPPPGHQRLRHYRDALRREPFLPRLLGFPFWLLIEMLALVFPRTYLDTRGRFIAIVFALGMLTGIAAWIWLGYYLLFVA